MVAGSGVKIGHPPVLQARILTLVLLLVPPDVFRRFQHLPRHLGILLLPQMGQQGHAVHVHVIDVAFPRELRVQCMVMCRLDDVHCAAEPLQIPAAFRMGAAGHPQPGVAHTADEILPGIPVQLFIP